MTSKTGWQFKWSLTYLASEIRRIGRCQQRLSFAQDYAWSTLSPSRGRTKIQIHRPQPAKWIKGLKYLLEQSHCVRGVLQVWLTSKMNIFWSAEAWAWSTNTYKQWTSTISRTTDGQPVPRCKPHAFSTAAVSSVTLCTRSLGSTRVTQWKKSRDLMQKRTFTDLMQALVGKRFLPCALEHFRWYLRCRTR